MSIRALFRRWPIASWLFMIHACVVLAFYVWWLLSAANPYNDMGWLIMAFVDFPIFFAYLPLVNQSSGHVFALVAIVFGGVEWALIGLVFDFAWRSIRRKLVIRGTKNI